MTLKHTNILLSHTQHMQPYAQRSLFTDHGQHQQVDAIHGVVVERHARVGLHVAADGGVLAHVALPLDSGLVVVVPQLCHRDGLQAHEKASSESLQVLLKVALKHSWVLFKTFVLPGEELPSAAHPE